MGKKHFTEAQIAFALRQAESGTSVAEIIRKLGISEQTFYRGKKRFAGLGIAELRRLRTLEEENSKLKQLVGGQRFRLLTLVDNNSRESLAIEAGQRLTGDDVVRVLEQVTSKRGKPQSIRVDNGPEFVSQSSDLWAYFKGARSMKSCETSSASSASRYSRSR
jgi:putative transposase